MMPKLNKNYLAMSIATAMLCAPSMAANADDSGYQLKTKSRLVYFDREYENPAKDRTQSAFSITADWTTPQYGGWIGIGLSPYFVEDLGSDGLVKADVLTVKDGEMSGFALLGQAYVNLTPIDGLAIKLGRQTHKSMLLSSSGSRAVANTYQGINALYKPMKGLSVYCAVYDKWSARNDDEFVGFRTDQTDEGAIDYISVIGLKYKFDAFTVETEYLNSKDYLSKFGLRGSYLTQFDDSSLKLSAGVFTSSDDGQLFVTAAESGDLDDEDRDGAVKGETRSDNDGMGVYAEAIWKRNNLQLSAAISKFDDIWIEDNFAGDHGRNPFPTRSRVGPDLTNANETVAKVSVIYNWQDLVPGLTTEIAAAQGWDAENSVDPALGTADEDWKELVVTYKVPTVKGLKFTGVWHDYNSDEVGNVDGVKEDETDIRLYLDYSYKFNF